MPWAGLLGPFRAKTKCGFRGVKGHDDLALTRGAQGHCTGFDSWLSWWGILAWSTRISAGEPATWPDRRKHPSVNPRQIPMTGLDLESFLLLLRADLGVWLMLALAVVGLAFLVWSSWRSRRALRNCLVVSLAAHLALLVFGSTFPGMLWSLSPSHRDRNERPHIREIRVATLVDPATRGVGQSLVSNRTTMAKGDAPAARAQGPRLDLVDVPLPLADAHLEVRRPPAAEPIASLLKPNLVEHSPAAAATAVPKPAPLTPAVRARRLAL